MADETQTEAAQESTVAEEKPFTLLCVDDEANILSALKRLFRSQGYTILTATSGKQGLELLEKEHVDLVISDMRMPEMNGAQFLEQVKNRWPDTVRLLLTGYAEMPATVDAINKGGISRYISKPWEDTDMVMLVREALERLQLERENRRLEALTQHQQALSEAHEKLKKGFITSVRVFSNLIELRGGVVAGHSRRVAELARNLTQRMELPEPEAQDVFLAALLHGIGKIGLSDKLLKKPFSSLVGEERAEVVKHPIKGQAALMALEQLNGAAKIIRSHHERFDGMGYPDGLAGCDIPLGARILAVANDFNEVQKGALLRKQLSETEALDFIRHGRGNRYDPAVVDAFFQVRGVAVTSFVTSAVTSAVNAGEIAVRTRRLMPGMVLTRDFITRDGVMLLAKDFQLDESLIEQIRTYERADGTIFTIYVGMKRG